jgi:hypothetical protein
MPLDFFLQGMVLVCYKAKHFVQKEWTQSICSKGRNGNVVALGIRGMMYKNL